MSIASDRNWPHQNQRQNAMGSSQQRGGFQHVPAYPPTSNFSMPSHGQYPQPTLQLEAFHDQVGFEGLGAYNLPQTATSLAAHESNAHGYNFNANGMNTANNVQRSMSGNSTNAGTTIAGTNSFDTNFTFTSPGPIPAAMSENVAPHDPSIQHASRAEFFGQQAQAHILQSTSPMSKRRRQDTVEGSGSGDDDDYGNDQYESMGYGAEGIESYGLDGCVNGGDPNFNNNMLSSPELQDSHGAIRAVGHGPESGYTGDPNMQLGPDGKPRQVHRAACVRCRTLKVRCESTSDPNTCRRCYTGRHECIIPGKKKRRQPPKREHLMNQIKEQGQVIERLQKELDRLGRERSVHNEPTRLSLSNTPLSHPGAPPAGVLHAPGSIPRPDVQDWIEKAREFITARGGLIDESTLLRPVEEEEDQTESGDDEDDDSDLLEGGQQWREPGLSDQETDGGEGNIVVEDPNGVRSPGSTDADAPGRHASPASTVRSGSREGSSQPELGRRRSSKKSPQPALAPLPATSAAPLKLIAQLSLSATKSQSPKSAGSGSRAGSTDPPDDTASPSASTPGGPRADSGDVDPSSQKSPKAEGASDEGYGAVAPGYFIARKDSIGDPSQFAPARQPIPHILMRNIVTPEEVEILFNIYFEKMNLSCSLLDPVLYTAKATYWRSPFLFTVVCAVASRYYEGHPGLYEELITYAQLAAGTALISGPKNVETVSAFILLSLYPVPMRRWEEDRTWLYLGLAIRVATDLNLHHPINVRPRDEMHARELLNRTRVWLNCYNLDRSTSSWLGKSSTISARDYTAYHSEEWYEVSKFNLRGFDIQLAAYNAELRLMSEFRERISGDSTSPTGLNKGIDFIRISSETDEKLVNLEVKWLDLFKQKTDPSDPQSRFRNSLVKVATRYSRLVALSFGFQHSFGKASSDTDKETFFGRCYRAAEDILIVFLEELSNQLEYIKHGPEAQCVFVTFAAAFLIKLLHPKYSLYLKQEQRSEIHQLVRRVIDIWSSPEVAVDDKHSPKLWSRFLDGLLSTPMARIDLPASISKSDSASYRRSTRRSTTSKASVDAVASSPLASSGNAPQVGSPAESFTSPITDSAPVMSPPQMDYVPMNAQQHNSNFFNFAPMPQEPTGKYQMTDPQQQLASAMSMNTNDQDFLSGGMYTNSSQIDVPAYYQPPLPFDRDMLQSVQSLQDASLWQNMPGFNWMNVLQQPQNADETMRDAFEPGLMNFDINSAGTHGY